MHFPSNESSDSEDEGSVRKKFEINTQPSPGSMTTKNQLKKGPHTIYSFDSWSILSAEGQIEERIEHYKRLLKETEQRILTREEMITTLQNQLKKIENMCQKGFENTEHYRFKYCVVSKELDNLRKICSQYKDNIENLIRINGELVCKDDLLSAQKQAESWKIQYEELSRIIELKQLSRVGQCTQANLDKTNIQEDLNLLKQQCSGIENLLQSQNNAIDNLIAKWIKEFEKINKQSLNSVDITEEMLNNVCSTQNENLQMILNENKSIKAEVLSLKQQLLDIPIVETLFQCKTSSNECKCKCQNKSNYNVKFAKEIQTDNTKDNGELLKQLKKLTAQSNEFNETTIKNLYQTVDTIENEKLEITVKYEEMCKRNLCTNSELQNKTLQLNTAMDEIEKLKVKISELHLLETLNHKNEKCSQSETSTKLVEFKDMQQLLRQYKEQVEFKKLENEKLRKREQELQLELEKKEYNAEQIEKDHETEVNRSKADFLQLQKKFDNLTSECKEKELKLVKEINEAMSLIELKNKEIENLQLQTSALNTKLNLVENEVKKIETENKKSLTEISFLFKHKENECFEIVQKFKEQEVYLADLEHENTDLKKKLKEIDNKDAIFLCPICLHKRKPCNLRSQLIFLLHNIQVSLIQILEEGDDYNLPPNTLDDFLHQTRKLSEILERRKYVDVTTKMSLLESSVFRKNVVSKQDCENINQDLTITSETRSEEIPEFESKLSNVDDIIKDTNLWKTMKQVLIGLEELKKQLKENSGVESKESFKHEYVSTTCNLQHQVHSASTIETDERTLDILEEELENQLHEDDEHNYLYQPKNYKEPVNLEPSKSYTLKSPCDDKSGCQRKSDKETEKHEDSHYNCPCAWCVQQKLHPFVSKRPQSSNSKGCNLSTCRTFRKTS